ncbi:MAG: NDP-sugar synthase [Candidatus Tectimicrobiota bacterium]
MKVGILAAGEGSRLRAGGWALPKPLLPIAGQPLIGRLLAALTPLAPEAIVCIINSQGTGIVDYVRQHHAALPITFVQRDTASSYESFTVLCAYLQDAPFLVTTVDSVFAPTFLTDFVSAAQQQPALDMLLSVTTFIDDEKPLYVRLNAQQRITQLGAQAHGSAYVTSGFYYCTPRISAACAHLAPTQMGALREFLAWLLQQGYALQGYLAPKTIDVDRPQDIAVAERFVREFEPSAAAEAG